MNPGPNNMNNSLYVLLSNIRSKRNEGPRTVPIQSAHILTASG